MEKVYIAGIAMTVFGRHLERSLEDLAGEALNGALADAGCERADLGVAFYSGMTNGPLQGQISIPGQVVFSKIHLQRIADQLSTRYVVVAREPMTLRKRMIQA